MCAKFAYVVVHKLVRGISLVFLGVFFTIFLCIRLLYCDFQIITKEKKIMLINFWRGKNSASGSRNIFYVNSLPMNQIKATDALNTELVNVSLFQMMHAAQRWADGGDPTLPPPKKKIMLALIFGRKVA